MLLHTLRIVILKNHIFYHASTAIFVIYILFIALHIHHIPIFHENIYFFPCPKGLIPNFHVIDENIGVRPAKLEYVLSFAAISFYCLFFVISAHPGFGIYDGSLAN